METTTLQPESDGSTITRARLQRLIDDFYADVRADDGLGPVFDAAIGDRWDAHLPRMVEFWSTVTLGTRSFRGDVFGKHMAVDGVEPEHFERWLTLWVRHTNRLFAPADAVELQQMALGVARNLYRGFFGRIPEFVVGDDAVHLDAGD